MSPTVVDPAKDNQEATTTAPDAETKPAESKGKSDALPDEQTVSAAAEILVFDKQGVKVPFGDVFASSKTVVVFIRHFHCGSCQNYVAQLASVPSQALEEAKTKIVLVGCGEWQLIEAYKKNTGFSGPVYAEPTRALYRALGMTRETLNRTPNGETPRSYVTGFLGNVVKSIWRGPMKNPNHVGKQGDVKQLGGDFILGPVNQCTYAHLMEHTEDHIEVVDLMKAAGVKYS